MQTTVMVAMVSSFLMKQKSLPMLSKQVFCSKKKKEIKYFKNTPVLDIKNVKGGLKPFAGMVSTDILLIYLRFGVFLFKKVNHENYENPKALEIPTQK